MICIILAAGYATRLYPLTKNFPKPLLEVAGKPILNHLIEDLDKFNLIDEYIVISNHKFADIFRDWALKMPQKITILDDGTESNETRLGAVKDIQFAIKELSINDNCLIMAGDNLLDFSLCDYIKFATKQNTSCVMYYSEQDESILPKMGIAEIENGILVNMEEKPAHPRTNYVCPPFYFYTAADLSHIDDALADGCGYDAPGSFPAWLCHKTTVRAWKMPGRRWDIGNIESYKTIKQLFRANR